jgi:hypothetical protein
MLRPPNTLSDWLQSKTLEERGVGGYEMAILKASYACPYFRYKGQPMDVYKSSSGTFVFSAT